MQIGTAELVREVRDLLGDNQVAFARRMGLNQTMISHYENGVRDLERSDNGLQLFLKLARQTPGDRRSEGLQQWISATIQHFEDHPVGGFILLDHDAMQIAVKGFDERENDLHLAAIVEMIESYGDDGDEFRDAHTRKIDFQEAVLTALCRHYAQEFSADEGSFTTEQMLQMMVDWLVQQKRLQTIATDRVTIDEDDE